MRTANASLAKVQVAFSYIILHHGARTDFTNVKVVGGAYNSGDRSIFARSIYLCDFPGLVVVIEANQRYVLWQMHDFTTMRQDNGDIVKSQPSISAATREVSVHCILDFNRKILYTTKELLMIHKANCAGYTF